MRDIGVAKQGFPSKALLKIEMRRYNCSTRRTEYQVKKPRVPGTFRAGCQQMSSSRGASERLNWIQVRHAFRDWSGEDARPTGRHDVGEWVLGWAGEWRRLGGGPLLVKVVGGEVFGRVVRMRVHTWRLRGGRGGRAARPVVLAAAVRARPAAAVRWALASPHTLPYTDHRTH